jgi:hypothetical protein
MVLFSHARVLLVALAFHGRGKLVVDLGKGPIHPS